MKATEKPVSKRWIVLHVCVLAATLVLCGLMFIDLVVKIAWFPDDFAFGWIASYVVFSILRSKTENQPPNPSQP